MTQNATYQFLGTRRMSSNYALRRTCTSRWHPPWRPDNLAAQSIWCLPDWSTPSSVTCLECGTTVWLHRSTWPLAYHSLAFLSPGRILRKNIEWITDIRSRGDVASFASHLAHLPWTPALSSRSRSRSSLFSYFYLPFLRTECGSLVMTIAMRRARA